MRESLCFVIAVSGSLALAPTRAVSAQSSDEAAVLAVVQRFFDTMASRDSAGAAATVTEDGVFYGSRGSGQVPAAMPFRSYLATLASRPARYLERMWNAQVRIHGTVATVWTPYDFHTDGRFSHCGVDAFTLLKAADRWRISHIAYTVEPTGCPPAPLGAVAPQGLVLAYDMETTTPAGRLRDLSGNDHHGEFTRADLVAGEHGRARRFTGVADRVHIPVHPAFDLDGPFSIAVRIRVDSLGLHQHIVACDDKWALWITPDNRYRLGDTRGGGWSTPPGTVQRGRWTSVVAVLRGTKGDVLDSETAALYLDGHLAEAERDLRTSAAQGTWNPGGLYASDACHVGFESHQGIESHRTLPFIGVLDELQVYARALTPVEITDFSSRPH